ncbi:MAG: hypothetical protein JSV77_07675 [Dehalococcoidales bacterium]|nr:MAG: hypothetical protein JSV77_07675 [Dehalococcoidales bacterium]
MSRPLWCWNDPVVTGFLRVITMINTIRALYTRARTVLREEGLVTTLRRVVSFFSRRFIRYDKLYLYKHSLEERAETDFLPRIDNFSMEIVSSNSQAAELAARGIDIRQLSPEFEKSLKKGAVAFCILVDNELAHIGWVAMTAEAKKTIDDTPYHVDFSNGEACTGSTRTLPKYGRQGLMVYGYFKRIQYLKEMGRTASRNAVAIDNIASQRAHARFNPQIYAKARLLKVLGLQFWKETSLDQETPFPQE